MPAYFHTNRTEWTSSSGGAASVQSSSISGVILRIVTVPGAGADAPSDNYDLTVTDSDGAVIFTNTALDTANAESHYPYDVTTGFPIAVNGPLTYTIANAGSANTGEIVVHYR
jgi:hypothetical protein